MADRTRIQEWFGSHREESYTTFEMSVMSRKWAEQDIADGRAFREDVQMGYDPHAPKKATVPRYVWWCLRNWVWYFTKHQIAKLICRRKGHSIIDVSTAGPDSGDMAWECKRCGESGYTPLY